MSRFLALAAGLLVFAACSTDEAPVAARDGITRIEPPFWWAGFEYEELQLLVQAGGIAEYTPSVTASGVSVARVERGDSPNYLFVYLDIGDASPGEFDIVFEHGDERIATAYELKPRIDGHVGTYDASDVIYLITPDRFANGDPSPSITAAMAATSRACSHISTISPAWASRRSG